MPGTLVAILLLGSLVLVHFSMRSRPLPPLRPLNVDDGLPLPEVAQASTVFSLTALFGTYLAIYLILGLPALLGLATGTVTALLVIRRWIDRRHSPSFEAFLERLLPKEQSNGAVFGLLLVFVQGAYSASELLILREIARAGLGFRPEHATMLALALAILGYFYVLFGGYMAVFRTDVLQFILLAGMGVVALVVASGDLHFSALRFTLGARSGYWEAPLATAPVARGVYQFLVAAVMGFGFLAASPDTWKRVFVLVQKGRHRARFRMFLIVGVLPFLLLIPVGAMSPVIPDGPADARLLFAGLLTSPFIFVAASLGLVASFLSSFNSALISTVHVGLILRRVEAPIEDETARFHWLMVASLIMISSVFIAFATGFGNPYLLANVLLGPYAVVAGIQIGSFGYVRRLRDNSLIWVTTAGLATWLVYLTGAKNIGSIPSTYELNMVPFGAGLCLGVAAVCWLLTKGKRR